MKKPCETCGTEMNVGPAALARGHGRFCSRECFQATQRNAIERTCEQCGTPFKIAAAERRGRGRYCSRGCYHQAQRVTRNPNVRYRMTRAKGHPIAPPSGILAVSRLRLYDRLGAGPHPCHWCGTPVDWNPGIGVTRNGSLIVDHLDHDPTNDDATNLVPSCNPCNSHRRQGGDSAIIQDDELTVVRASTGSRVRAVERICEHCGTAFLAARYEVATGKARFCSRSCARRQPRATRQPAQPRS